jgi:hypothetical protein
MVTLPTSTSAAAGWQVVDFLRLALRTAPAAGGQASLDAGQLDPEELWLLDHAVIQCDSTSKTTLRLYDSAPEPLRILDGSSAGNFSVADWPNGLQVAPGGSLVAVWVGASAGARGVLTVQGRVLRRS